MKMEATNSSVQKSIVFGASGFIGTRLVERLAKRGEKVVAIDILPPRVNVAGVSYRTHDVRREIPFESADVGARIYNLAATHRTPGHPPEEYYDTNVHGAFNVTSFAESIECSELVFTSSISVYGPSESIITENSPLRPTSDYGRSKAMAEIVHRRWRAGASGRKLVVVRPGVVFGPGERGNYTNLARALQRGVFAYPGRKTTIKSGGYVDELLRAIEFSLSLGDVDTTFNFAYPDESTIEQIVGSFGVVMNCKSDYPVVPIWLLIFVARSCEFLSSVGIKNPIHRERVLKLVNSTRIAPAWLLGNRYDFASDVESALRAWSAETNGKFL